jgi:hypothetical protein
MSPTYEQNKKHIYNYINKNKDETKLRCKLNQRKYEQRKLHNKLQTYEFIALVFLKILL